MNKVLIGLLLAFGLSTTSLGYLYRRQSAALGAVVAERDGLSKALSRAVERGERDRRVLVAREAKIASEAHKLAQAQEALSQALQRNNAWSDTDVPTEAQQALQGRSGGPNSGPASLLHD